ncbi:MAG: DUF924 domain-containing protein [Acidiferrobacterales bacterium]|nr:DUF924 domain-containing protein [Acidiferrobacterales bacterium]
MEFDVDAILDFWFADSEQSEEEFHRRMEMWFLDPEFFDQAVLKYEPLIEYVANGHAVNVESDPKGILASIIALDQFPRNIYRGKPQAFAYDSKALRLTNKVIESGLDRTMTYLERLFAYLPLQHSEDLQVQQLSVEMFGSLVDMAQTQARMEQAQESLVYAEMHRDIIMRFGRFPHRNEILDRESTAEELQYLADGAETFGQVKK